MACPLAILRGSGGRRFRELGPDVRRRLLVRVRAIVRGVRVVLRGPWVGSPYRARLRISGRGRSDPARHGDQPRTLAAPLRRRSRDRRTSGRSEARCRWAGHSSRNCRSHGEGLRLPAWRRRLGAGSSADSQVRRRRSSRGPAGVLCRWENERRHIARSFRTRAYGRDAHGGDIKGMGTKYSPRAGSDRDVSSRSRRTSAVDPACRGCADACHRVRQRGWPASVTLRAPAAGARHSHGSRGVKP